MNKIPAAKTPHSNSSSVITRLQPLASYLPCGSILIYNNGLVISGKRTRDSWTAPRTMPMGYSGDYSPTNTPKGGLPGLQQPIICHADPHLPLAPC